MKIEIKAEPVLVLDSEQDWIRRVPQSLPKPNRCDEEFLWLDSQGHVMEIGADFSAAEDMGTYPVTVYRLTPASMAEKQRWE